jgi:hypothetical protein
MKKALKINNKDISELLNCTEQNIRNHSNPKKKLGKIPISMLFIYRKFNWHQGVFDETIRIAPTQTLLLEGVGAGQSAFRKTLSRIIWVEIDPESGFKRVIARDGEKVKTEMLNFLKDQNKHFSAELTDKAADYTISGVP